MKKIKVVDSQIPTNYKEIKKFTDIRRIKLPKDYIAFLLKYNGGHPSQCMVDFVEPIEEIEEGSDLAWFCALCPGYENDLNVCYEIFKNRIPKEFLPIGHDSGGNLICLCLSGENYGKIYYWDHNWETEEGEEPTYDNVYLAANSFTDFINGLYKFDLEEDESGKDIYISTHDKYSLPTSHYIKKHGKAITDFFDKAPKSVEEFIIKEFTANGDLLLSFKANGKEHFRRLNKDGKIIAGE